MRSNVPCEICEAQAGYWATINHYHHYKCHRCGQLFVSPRPSQQELDVCYQDGAYYGTAQAQEARLLKEASQRLTRLDLLCSRFGLEKRILDVGCATGYF